MKITLSVLALILFLNFSNGQSILREGDIAITGVISKNGTSDSFSFVLLTQVDLGTTIHFTDHGWLAGGGWRRPSGEGIITWISNTNLDCGTEIIITNTNGNIYSATYGTANKTEGNFALSTHGDQLLAFQGSLQSPTFLYAIQFASASGWNNATSSKTSAVPAGLTEGINAINLGGFDNNKFKCSATSNRYHILSAMANVNTSNWEQTNRIIHLEGCAYTSPCTSFPTGTIVWDGSWVGGTPDLGTSVIISANYNTLANGSFQAYDLTIDSGYTVTVENKTYIEIENNVTINGNLVLETQANFVQNKKEGLYNVNEGAISIAKKETSLKHAWYYYTYWSSPTKTTTLEASFPDIHRRFWFNADNFIDTNRDDIDDNGDDWQVGLGSDIMPAGLGYAITSNKTGEFPRRDSISFEGAFNNGNITISTTYNDLNPGYKWNLIGNPYPSALDFVAFQQANATVIDGVAYFWSQASPFSEENPGHATYNFNPNDYATFTIGTGGIAGGDASKIPDGTISSGQGFFIVSKKKANATFTNAMRIRNNNNLLFRTHSKNKSNKGDDVEEPEIIRDRLWLNLTTSIGTFNQILIGYVDGATNGNDGLSYDAPKLNIENTPTVFYSLMDNNSTKYVIQGKSVSSINEDEIIKLGFINNMDNTNTFELTIAKLEGDFLSKHPVYVKDHILNKTHNLTESNYTFTSQMGTYNNRFEILFKTHVLSNTSTKTNSEELSIISLENNSFQVLTSNEATIHSLYVFDLQGRKIYTLKEKNSSNTIVLKNIKKSIYIAKIQLSNGAIYTKKIPSK